MLAPAKSIGLGILFRQVSFIHSFDFKWNFQVPDYRNLVTTVSECLQGVSRSREKAIGSPELMSTSCGIFEKKMVSFAEK
jgi:hypothetical protein